MRLDELTHPEVERRLEAGAVALWPVGATEAHGPHLPLGTDVFIAEETCRRVAERAPEVLGLEAVVLPPLAFTITECARPFSGTLSLPRDAVVAYVDAVLAAATEQGFRSVCLVNAHLEPAHRFALRDAVKAAAARGAPAVLADPCERRWVPLGTEEFRSGACHAGRYETSLVLAARPELVDQTTAATLPAAQIDLMGAMKAGARTFLDMGAEQAYVGAPAEGTAAEGAASYDTLCHITFEVLKESLASDSGSKDR